ncbi:WD40 repeat-like protein [Wallemia mellicola]|uniref:WD40 repeat-like protein n=1 Tax=Wallemia mellicola TaxID=1708541 RepID=A0A4T0U834_9BASI|nr:hypothetical protein E3Q24_02616 [Wallemia mellicola]TIB81963.1 WD40 repeat-like protein [Wallemia mellicola]TIB85434.1 WD40 repeat-like protein [Wallemia mellicola]TIB88551.1 WD40 repeat-like protein [Wallemia mellicola]TIB94382.1 WD40 repeat-like protein [Wallemia mellicola]
MSIYFCCHWWYEFKEMPLFNCTQDRMRTKTLEIRWHNQLPIYSMDIQPYSSNALKKVLNSAEISQHQTYRLATGGADHQVRLWLIHPQQNIRDSNANTILQNPHQPRAEYLCTLSRHTNPVNVVRFCPKVTLGETLASAGDDGNVLLWIPSDQKTASYGESSSEDLQFEKEFWRVRIMARCARDAEVYDLAWSPTGEYFVAGSTDNTARIFSAIDGVCLHQITEHNHYVQGVSWDPFGSLIATQSSDRSLNVHSVKNYEKGGLSVHSISKFSKSDVHAHTPKQLTHKRSSSSTMNNNGRRRLSVASATSENDHSQSLSQEPGLQTPMQPPSRRSSLSQQQSQSNIPSSAASSPLTPVKRSPSPLPAIKTPSNKLNERISYGDEGFTQFFRRLSFSPDGSILVTPSAQSDDIPSEDGKKKSIAKSSVLIYGRSNLNNPLAVLPGHKSATVGVRFNPILFNLRQRSEKPAFDLPYRMIYAVVSKESIIIYDTQQLSPISILSNLHWAAFTDVTWSPDGQSLMLASLDGYCSIIVFDPEELGTPYKEQQHQLQMSAIAENVQVTPSQSHTNTHVDIQAEKQVENQTVVNQLPVKKKRRVELTRVE